MAITEQNVVWSVFLLTQDKKHMHMGKGWEAFLSAVKDFKCRANEDHRDIVVGTWTTDTGVNQWTWDSMNDAPALLPNFENDYERRVQAHS